MGFTGFTCFFSYIFRGSTGRGALYRLDCLARLYTVRTSSPSSELEDNIVRLIPSQSPRSNICKLVDLFRVSHTHRDIFFLHEFSSFSFSADQIFAKYFSPFPRSVTTSSELEDNIVRLIPSHSFSSSDICKLLDLFRVPHIVIFFPSKYFPPLPSPLTKYCVTRAPLLYFIRS